MYVSCIFCTSLSQASKVFPRGLDTQVYHAQTSLLVLTATGSGAQDPSRPGCLGSCYGVPPCVWSRTTIDPRNGICAKCSLGSVEEAIRLPQRSAWLQTQGLPYVARAREGSFGMQQSVIRCERQVLKHRPALEPKNWGYLNETSL